MEAKTSDLAAMVRTVASGGKLGPACGGSDVEKAEQRLLAIARGCFDYRGGYHDEHDLGIYHHGIQTVANAIAAALKHDPNDMQVNVLERVGTAKA
jgi:hypothetical protein